LGGEDPWATWSRQWSAALSDAGQLVTASTRTPRVVQYGHSTSRYSRLSSTIWHRRIAPIHRLFKSSRSLTTGRDVPCVTRRLNPL